jgi:hypothetical protein
MHKVIILIGELEDPEKFEASWPWFLHLAERMPGLQREVTSRTSHQIFGDFRCSLVHELHFNTEQEAREALRTPEGQAAGQTLQNITHGNAVILLAQHQEDTLDNIRESSSPPEDA